MSRPLLLLSSVTLLGVACRDVPTAIDPVAMSISDAEHEDGNEHFFFLPPLVGSPSVSGTFDASLLPEVEICVWDGSDCKVTLGVFNENTGPGSEAVRVDAANEQYVVNWHTGPMLDGHQLGDGETYRLRVLVQGQELGYADIDVVGSAKELKNVDAETTIPLLEGRTLPIKFRIEEGALNANPVTVAAGMAHTCAVATDGRAYCWGHNIYGQLGNGVVGGPGGRGAYFDTPQLVAGGHRWRAVAASYQHTCGLTTEERILCWGSNAEGQLGLGAIDYVAHPTPEPVAANMTFAALADLGDYGSYHSCGLTLAGELYCWGLNSFGELGIGITSYVESTPVLAAGGTRFSEVGIGNRFTCGLRIDAAILCWGSDGFFGQLGRGYVLQPPAWSSPVPEPVVGGYSFQAVSVGGTVVCGIGMSGAAICWGGNLWRQLGRGETGGGRSPTPEPVTGNYQFAQLSSGWGHTCGVDVTGIGICWGLDDFSQLAGDPFYPYYSGYPTPVRWGRPEEPFRELVAGYKHTCGVTMSDTVYCWGWGARGQLGIGVGWGNYYQVGLAVQIP